MLHGDRGHPHKSIRMDGAPLRYFFVLKPDELATLTRCDADLRQSKTGRCSGSSRDVFQEVSAIGHFLLHRIGSPTVAAVYDRRQSTIARSPAVIDRRYSSQCAQPFLPGLA